MSRTNYVKRLRRSDESRLDTMKTISTTFISQHRLLKPYQKCKPVRQNAIRCRIVKVLTVKCSTSKDISSETAVSESPQAVNRIEKLRVSIALLGFICAGVVNRVSYKMTLVPLKDYIFFVAQLQTLVYLAVYLPTLYVRYKSGLVTNEMLAISKKPFILIGFCESVATLLMLASAARLPGVLLPILQQLIVLWQMILSGFLLRTRYSSFQFIGAGLIVVGSAMASQATVATGNSGQTNLFYVMILNTAFFLYALAGVIKDKIFKQSKELLKGQNLDIFVVNSFGSVAQTVGTLILFPLMLRLKDLSIQDIPRYLSETITCFCGINPTPTSNCAGAPLAVLAYFAFNLGFNICALYLVRKVGAVVVSIAASIIVPTTVAVFSLPLPILGPGDQLSTVFLIGSAILVAGMLTYSTKEIYELIQSNRKTD